MPWTIAVVLFLLWGIGLATSHGASIHMLAAGAFFAILVRLVQIRRDRLQTVAAAGTP